MSLSIEPGSTELPVPAKPLVPPDEAADPLLQAQQKIANLELALRTSRQIGMAVGIIVERCKVDPEAAFHILVRASQREHRKIHDLAEELVLTGIIPDL